MRRLFLIPLIAMCAAAQAWQAGVAKIDITPAGPIWMAGYAARAHPSEGVQQNLFVKALAIDDGRKGRVVIVSSDLIGLPRGVADEVAIACLKKYGLERGQLVLNVSHTHSGPVVWPNLSEMYPMDAEQRAVVEAFTRKLVTQMTDAVGAALANLQPASVEYSLGEAGFAMNRRMPDGKGAVKLSPNPAGPVDHSVPTLVVRSKSGKTIGILFNYACHNTTLTGEFYQLSGDYAGYAQADLEKRYDGAVALYVAGCGGDQNPEPRSTLDLAKRHGEALAAAVAKLVDGKGEVLRGKIRSGFQLTDLPYQPFGKNDFEADLKSTNKYVVGRAKNMLKAIEDRTIPRTLPYPIQVLKLGQMSIVTLGGEVVVDYCLRLRKETGNAKLMVLGYSNDVMCYIPTRKIIEEGGYEGKDSFVYYGQPAPISVNAEDMIIDRVKALLQRVK